MAEILSKRELAAKIYEFQVAAPRIARKALAGQFVIVMADATSERIPLTIADFDRTTGSITLVLMVVGASSWKIAQLQQGGTLHALIGPLGHPSQIEPAATVVMVAGGVGTAPVFPIARAYRERGSRVITIQGARARQLLFWTERMQSVSDELVITTDDGSAGRRGLVTEPLRELLAADAERRIGLVVAIGPTVMMRFCAATTEPFGVRTMVSLNSIMVDGTGMCGGCRVEVGGESRFTCVDGPEFDGHQVDWEGLMSRQKTYREHEDCSLKRLTA